jgi:hypothetical protein
MTQDLYYYESGYLTPELGYFTYVADAESIQTSTSTLTVVVGKIVQAESAMTSSSTITATVSNQRGADLFAFANAALAIEVQRIRDNNTSATSVFDVATDATRTRYISASEDAAFSISLDSLRVRYEEAAIDAAFSLAASPEYYKGTSVELTSTASLTAVGTFPVSTTAQLYSQSSLDAILNIIHQGNAALASQASTNASLSTIKQAVINCQSLFTPAVVCNAIVDNSVTASSTTSLTAQPTFTFAISASITATASLALEINKIQQGAGDLTSSFTQDTNNLRIRYETVSLSSSATQLTQANRTTGSVLANLTTAFEQNLVNERTRNVPSTLSTEFTQTTTNSRTRDNLVAQTSEFTETVVPNTTSSASANLTAFYVEIVAFLKYVGNDSHMPVVATMSITPNRIRATDISLSSQAQQTCQATYPVYYSASLVSEFSLTLTKQYGFNLVTASVYLYHRDMVVDSEKNTYQLSSESTTSTNFFLTKITKNGTIQWQYSVETSTGLLLDSSQNLYLTSATSLTKITPSGSIVWKKTISPYSIERVVIDNNDNIWIAQANFTGGDSYLYITKISSSGTVLWSQNDNKPGYVVPTPGSGSPTVGNGTWVSATKTSNSVTFTRKYRDGYTGDTYSNAYLTEVITIPNSYPTSGSISKILRRFPTYATYSGTLPAVNTIYAQRDSLGNTYILNYYPDDIVPTIEKLSPSGARVWQITLNPPPPGSQNWGWTSDGFRNFFVDSQNRLVIVYDRTVFPAEGGFYVRTEFLYVNSVSRVIENQFYLRNDASLYCDEVFVNSDGEIFISGSDAGKVWSTYLPPGGEGFGTHQPNNWSYIGLTYTSSSILPNKSSPTGTTTVSSGWTTSSHTPTFTTVTTPTFGSSSLSNTNTPLLINSFDIVKNTVNIVAFVTLDVDNTVIARTPASIASESSQTTNSTRLRNIPSSLSAQASLYLSPYDFRKAEASLTAQATVLAQPYDYTKATASLQSEFSLTINSEVGIIGEMFAFTNASLTLVSSVNKPFTAALDSTLQLTASVQRINFADLVAFTNATLTANTSRTRTTAVNLVTTSQLDCAFTVVKVGVSTEPVVASLDCNVEVLRTVSAAVTSQAQLTLIGGKLVGVTANLQAFDTVLAVGKILSLDPYYQLKIEGATGELWIRPETRLLEVCGEARGLIIRRESRLLTINQETRVNIIKGYPS